MARRKIIAGNWKMNCNIKEAVSLVKELKINFEDEVVVCPPFTALDAVSKELKGSKIAVGAQNMYLEDSGAFTGEISPIMLKELCSYVIIGHSERRAYFNEDNTLINKKVKKALEHGLKPIVCVGEKLSERESGKTEKIVKDHVLGALNGLSKKDILKIVIAYEPVWAIGTGKTASPQQAEEVHKFIRELIKKEYDDEVSSKIKIIYGGSVKSSNAASLLSQKDIDGALVGGASLDASEFIKIARS